MSGPLFTIRALSRTGWFLITRVDRQPCPTDPGSPPLRLLPGRRHRPTLVPDPAPASRELDWPSARGDRRSRASTRS